jgi:H+/Cl- antiporter ClcA
MTPQIPIPTDSLHKFMSLLGLALLLSALLGFCGIYTTTLDRKIALVEEISQLELNQRRTPLEDRRLSLRRKVLEVTQSNEQAFQWAVGIAFGLGLLLIVFGGVAWHRKGQVLEDRLKELQVRKLEVELITLEASLKTVATHNAVTISDRADE